MRICAIFLLLFLQLSNTAGAAVEDELELIKKQLAAMQTKVGQLEDKVDRQENQIRSHESSKEAYEQRIATLEGELAAQAEAVAPKTSSPTAAKWTPEIGVVADTVVTLTGSKEDEEGNNRLSVRELELILGSSVDPYSRLDATVAFSDLEDEPVHLEEAYLTRFGLPLETTARVGKFKPKVGRAIPVHLDSLETVDEPLVIQRYFGHHGFSKSGVDLTKSIDPGWPMTHELTLGVLEGGNGEEGTAFGTTSKAPTLYAHFKNYVDLNDTTGLQIGFTPMAGSVDDEPNFQSTVLGADVTLTHQLDANRSVKWQNEAYHLSRRKTAGVDLDTDGFNDTNPDGHLWGAYSLLDYRFHPRWSAGVRYDFAELVDVDPTENVRDEEHGQTGYLTFHQSEFARWRVQYTRTELITGRDDNTVYLQGTFAIGDHKHKVQ